MRFIFDFIIIFLILTSAYWIFFLMRSFFYEKEKNKTKISRGILILIIALFGGAVFYGSFIVPKQLKITEYQIKIGKTVEQETIKIALLTDIHAGPYKQNSFVQKIVTLTTKLNPDLILLGGDLIDSKESEAKFLTPLQSLSEQFPTFAITGNHEYHVGLNETKNYQDKTAKLRLLFEQINIPFLDNESQKLQIKNNAPFNLTGVEEFWSPKYDLQKAQSAVDFSLPSLLLSHTPDVLLDPSLGAYDLILAGHTHGGQIRLPFIGALLGVPTELGRKYEQGEFLINDKKVIISTGLGETGVRARLFCPPEIVLITLDL